ncbi:hypothetical protein FRC09_012244 [Ceratobasidium sp. 395]|nr:hypothetical protein FRC09_012244 [Ceratobasidium sp. 395]
MTQDLNIDPELLGAHPYGPPPGHIALLPTSPGLQGEGHPPLVPPPMAVLTHDLSAALGPFYAGMQEQAQALLQINLSIEKLMGHLNDRLSATEVALRSLAAGDESEDAAKAVPKKRTRTGDAKKAVPEDDTLARLQTIVRRVLKSGCKVQHFKELQEGLSADELKKRIEEDPDEPWRPDFLKSMRSTCNDFWVGKIMKAVLNDAQGKELVEAGVIPAEFWTEEILTKHVLMSMWLSAQKEVKKQVSEEARARAEANAKRNKRKGRRTRLLAARCAIAEGDSDHPPFEYLVGDEMRPIPEELLVPEVMSDVVSEPCSTQAEMPRGVTLDDYQKGRKGFKWEGIPPFYRHEKFNKIFTAMDEVLVQRPQHQALSSRYYATERTRGQRKETDKSKAKDIPVSMLYRCHIKNEWYNKLSEAQRGALRPSPEGWEVTDEESDSN